MHYPTHSSIIIMDPVHNRLTPEDFGTLCMLGKGAFAKVLLVRKHADHKLYAMKVIRKKNISAKKQEAFVSTERNVLVEVNHPFIIKLYNTFQSTKSVFFVLEYCPGGELYQQIARKRRFPEEECRFYATQMVLALEYLHNKNIVYRE